MGKITGFLELRTRDRRTRTPSERASSTGTSSRRSSPRRSSAARARAAWIAASPSATRAVRSGTSSPTGTTWCTAAAGRRRSTGCTPPTTSRSSPAASARRRARRPASSTSTTTPVTIKQIEKQHHRPRLHRGLGSTARAANTAPARRWRSSARAPPGMACAQQLARAGHTVTVFERDDRIGGLLRYGIPDFKMEKWLIDRRMEQMAAEGRHVPDRRARGRDVTGRATAQGIRRRRAVRRRDPAARSAGPGPRAARASTSPWSSCRSRTRSSPGDRVRGPAAGDGQARRHPRRRRHGQRLPRHVEPPGRRLRPPVRAPARAAEGSARGSPWPNWPMILRTLQLARGGRDPRLEHQHQGASAATSTAT